MRFDQPEIGIVLFVIQLSVLEGIVDHDDHDRQIHVDQLSEIIPLLEQRIKLPVEKDGQIVFFIQSLDRLEDVFLCPEIDRIIEIEYLDQKGKVLSAKARKKLVISRKAHSYKIKSTDSKYLKSAATCTKKAVYYYSCKCGRKNKKTFTSGKALGHSYELSLKPATAGSDGSIVNKCSRCGKKTKTVIYKASKVSIPKKYQSVAYKGNNAEKTTVSVKNRKNKTISKAYYDISFDNDYVHRTGTVTITFKGNYSGTVTRNYKITGVPEQ